MITYVISCLDNVNGLLYTGFLTIIIYYNYYYTFIMRRVSGLKTCSKALKLNCMMAPCKRQLKATRHLICGCCSNWVDFVKSRCEKSWAEVQADSFSF